MNADEGLAGAGRTGLGHVDEPERLRALEQQGLHETSFAAVAAGSRHVSP
jgi:hypothetical protein